MYIESFKVDIRQIFFYVDHFLPVDEESAMANYYAILKQ